MKRALAMILICLILTPCAALAQQPAKPKVGVSEELGKALEVALAEVEHLRNQTKIKDEIIVGKDQQIAALNGFIKIQSEQASAWARAAAERKEALASDDKAFQVQGEELLRVRTERDKARSGQKAWGAVGLVLGIALGVFSQRR